MSGYKTWMAKQRGNPLLLLGAAFGFSLSFYGTYRFVYAPWAARSRFAENESYAMILLEKKPKEDDNNSF